MRAEAGHHSWLDVNLAGSERARPPRAVGSPRDRSRHRGDRLWPGRTIRVLRRVCQATYRSFPSRRTVAGSEQTTFDLRQNSSEVSTMTSLAAPAPLRALKASWSLLYPACSLIPTNRRATSLIRERSGAFRRSPIPGGSTPSLWWNVKLPMFFRRRGGLNVQEGLSREKRPRRIGQDRRSSPLPGFRTPRINESTTKLEGSSRFRRTFATSSSCIAG